MLTFGICVTLMCMCVDVDPSDIDLSLGDLSLGGPPPVVAPVSSPQHTTVSVLDKVGPACNAARRFICQGQAAHPELIRALLARRRIRACQVSRCVATDVCMRMRECTGVPMPLGWPSWLWLASFVFSGCPFSFHRPMHVIVPYCHWELRLVLISCSVPILLQRLYGLKAQLALLGSITFTSATMDSLMFLKPAMRGRVRFVEVPEYTASAFRHSSRILVNSFASGELCCSCRLASPCVLSWTHVRIRVYISQDCVAEGRDITAIVPEIDSIRHHYLKALEGAPAPLQVCDLSASPVLCLGSCNVYL